MRSIGIFSRKGGVGKSTLAIHLSTLAQAEGRTLLIDTDPQASLEFWWKRRASETLGLATRPLAEIGSMLRAAREAEVRTVLVDTPPSIDATVTPAIAAMDLVLIPMRPSTLDLASAIATIELARRAGTEFGCVLSMCPPQRGAGEPAPVREVREVLAGLDAPVFAATIAHRVGFQNAINSGETVDEFDPSGAAAAEVAALWAEIKQRLR